MGGFVSGKRKVGMNNEKHVVSIGEAFEYFILDKQAKNLSSYSIRNYKQAYECFLHIELDDDDSLDISELYKLYVDQWKATMIQSDMRYATINTFIGNFRVFLNWCMEDERKLIEPRYKVELIKGQEPLPKIFTDDEVEALLKKPSRVSGRNVWFEWRNWGIATWIVGTGTRASTVANVKIGDIDFNNKEIALQHTKNKKAQVLPLGDSLAKAMKEYIKVCRNGCGKGEYLFPDAYSCQLDYFAMAHSFANYCRDRGVEHTNLHGLRHYFATAYARNGGSGDKLQKLLGHSTYGMTQRYLHLVDRDLKDDFADFNALDMIKKRGKKNK